MSMYETGGTPRRQVRRDSLDGGNGMGRIFWNGVNESEQWR